MKYLILTLFILSYLPIFGQGYTVTGSVQDETGAPVPFSNIVTKDKEYYAVASENGTFTIKGVKQGTYVFTISAVGFLTRTTTLSISGDSTLEVVLSENTEALDDVLVKSKSQARRQNEKAVTITSLGTQRVIDRALGAEELLKESAGVVVRQTGGLGSQVNINLNGLSQQAVRIFYDGIPIEVFGGGIQINTIPVDALQRVDVYKGIMPIDVGTDALGGGINLVPNKKNKEYLRTSYSVGSFNTHRLTLNGRKKISDKASISALSFFNYSDNDYVMRNIENSTQGEFGLVNDFIDARRFHSRHISGYLEASLRLQDLTWADQLEVTGAYSARDDQIQNGVQLIATSVGEAERARNTLSARLDYRKKLFQDKLDLRYYGVLARTTTKANDSTNNTYNWLGEIIAENGDGAEIAANATLREGTNLSTAHRLVASYELLENFNVTVSDFFRNSRIDGDDPAGPRLNINGQEIDPNTIPSTLQQNILGAQLEAVFLDKTLTAQAFYKNYDYQAETIDILQTGGDRIPTRIVSQNNNGYGFALKYAVNDNLFIRSSYERALRMPNENEVFGNFVFIRPNFELRPEQSDNLNVGINYSRDLSTATSFSVGINGFLRNREDLIRLDNFGPESALFVNEAQVDGKGLEFSASVTPITNLNFSGSYTTQSNEIAAVATDQDPGSIGAEVPNIPLTFYNARVNYTFNEFLRSSNDLELFYNYVVVDRYSINEVTDLDSANPDFIIPTQRVHSAGLTYRFRESGLNLSLNVNNIFNAEVFDNFRVPRPGINYTFKVNYSIF